VTPLRSDSRLRRHPLKARWHIAPVSPAAAMWNRIGGLLDAAGRVTGLDPAAMLAVWIVECGGLDFRRGKPVLRFEPHQFFARWGQANETLFDRHFRFGGRNGTEGAKWQNHAMRTSPDDAWRRFHGEQGTEYEAFALASRLAGEETACLCASFGGPQIMGFNHAACGFPDVHAFVAAISESAGAQLRAFIALIQAWKLDDEMRERRWADFARRYNGPGFAKNAYDQKLAAAYQKWSRA